MEPVVVEQLGRKRAQAGVEPVGLPEKQATLGEDGRRTAEQVLERRPRGPIGVAPLDGLLELPGVADEDDALRGLRDGQRVGEVELAGLVDDQHVHDASCLLTATRARRCPAEHLDVAVVEGPERLAVVGEGSDAGGCLVVTCGHRRASGLSPSRRRAPPAAGGR